MARPRSVHACTRCGAQQPRWLGRCPECSSWGTLVEEPLREGEAPARELVAPASAAKPRRLAEIDPNAAPRIPTGISELDRVLGGGLVPGAVVLLAGEPGVGKSTLSLQLAARVRAPGPILYVTGEESPEQLRLRAERLADLPNDLLVVSETRVEALADPWRDFAPAVVVVDSIQTMRTDRVESAPGSVAQVRECAALLAATAKAQGTALLLVGHVTKEGLIAGPRVLEHMVDAVLNFEGDRGHAFRILRASKNRFGSTQEVGVFAMTDAGLETVENPSELFLTERRVGSPGSCIVPLVEGTRPLLVEVQALVAPAGYGTARRTCLGIDDARVALLLAVLDRRTDVELLSRDVYVNATGGVRVGEPGADLGVALALVSSRLDVAVPADAVACGEIGLGGEVRRIARTDLRIREAVRLGFRRVLVPEGAVGATSRDGAEIVPIRDVGAAVAWLRRAASTPVRGSVTNR